MRLRRIQRSRQRRRSPIAASLTIALVILAAPATEITATDPPTAAEPTAQASSALEVIESSRGGRHWIDESTDPPKTPEQTLQSFSIEPGYEISLFAAEPLVRDPVAICFDAAGKMYVVEYGDYPIGPEDGGDPLSRIVILQDTDGDGKADQRTVFAEKLDFAHSLMPYRGGLLVGAKTKVLHLVDTDGDSVADRTTTLLDGFTPAHPQMQVGNPRYGIDNWIYFNYGPGEVTTLENAEQTIKLPRKDFRLDPKTMAIESEPGMGQFGNTVDRWGNRFYCTNRNPIITTLLPTNVLKRNPFLVISDASYDVAPSGGDSRVYPKVAMKSNYLSHAGTHTSACGTTAYVGPLGDPSFQNSVFVCEPIGHLVTRSVIEADGVGLQARRAQAKADFIASTDTWFRPSSLATGPDGGLYLADMYRLWVEHPKFLPPEIAAKLDWRAGEDRGRIYRIVPKDASLGQYQAPQTIDDQVAMLASDNGWQQFTAQRLLVERGDASVAMKVTPYLTHARPTTRIHALWTLHGLGKLDAEQLQAICEDSDSRCRTHGLKVAALVADASLRESIAKAAADDPSIQVRFQLAQLLGTLPAGKVLTEVGIKLARQDGSDRRFADGWLTSMSRNSGEMLIRLAGTNEASFGQGQAGLIKRLAEVVGARGDQAELRRVLDSLGQGALNSTFESAVLSGLASGLSRYRGSMGRLSLAQLINQPPESLAESVAGLDRILERNRKLAGDDRASVRERIAAIELLSHQSSEANQTLYLGILENHPTTAIQSAVVAAIGRSPSTENVRALVERWQDLRPSVRPEVLTILLRRHESTTMMLDAIGAKQISAAGLSLDQRVRLLKHPNEAIRSSATRLLGGAVSKDRQKVAKTYEAALSMTADPTAGKQVFAKVCASCHRVAGEGQLTGPDLTDASNRSKAALLYDILDPNSKVEPRFTASTVLTVDGDVFSGLIDQEGDEAIVLKMAEGKSKTIGRSEIEQIKVSEVSLMPEGIEKDITPQQMADLLAFLTGR
ncbi:PVC-type heme-binding CxxCH protein [Roseiconus lacunae]|uniref:PVC-type heme-binding CxxCH protein n=1 Tax=Roseiconus lacunae TaxID=2605694 RepID=UPI0011F17DF6|nr:PVC-type heme-binding CxxCH protein [Roseiconus lacunae]